MKSSLRRVHPRPQMSSCLRKRMARALTAGCQCLIAEISVILPVAFGRGRPQRKIIPSIIAFISAIKHPVTLKVSEYLYPFRR